MVRLSYLARRKGFKAVEHRMFSSQSVREVPIEEFGPCRRGRIRDRSSQLWGLTAPQTTAPSSGSDLALPLAISCNRSRLTSLDHLHKQPIFGRHMFHAWHTGRTEELLIVTERAVWRFDPLPKALRRLTSRLRVQSLSIGTHSLDRISSSASATIPSGLDSIIPWEYRAP